jgi:alginate export protein
MTPFRNGTIAVFVVASLISASRADAQGVTKPLTIGKVTVAGSFRSRVEAWNWFGDAAAGEYTYPGSLFRIGLSSSKKTIAWQAEVAVPFMLALPNDAMTPGATGALGLGANYFAANDNRTDIARLFVKQAAVRITSVRGVPGQSIKIGRFEFIDGTETTPADATLAALKRERIAHRLIGNFGFTHIGRSVDGALYGLDRDAWNVTAVAFRPTRGVFDVDGWDDLDVNVLYGAVTRHTASKAHPSEWRAFAIGYDDYRANVVKVDNRPLAPRRADTSSIAIGTFGGHYLRSDKTARGTIDLLLWGAGQAGSWGSQSHCAGAFAVEGGWQPDIEWAPWFRGGWNYGSGDGDAADARHGTFFQLLPTPRVYARLPFFNMMNTSDVFGEALVRPTKSVTLRGDVHVLHLADAADLWYQGGGAFQPSTFGYAGRPSSGNASLATLTDISADVAVSPRLTLSGYFGYAAGRPVTDALYGGGSSRLAYLEVLVKF